MYKSIKYLIGFFILFQNFAAKTQSLNIDSMISKIQVPENMSNIARYNEIAWTFRSLNPDSSLHYSKKAIELSKKYEDYVGLSRSYSYAGIAMRNKEHLVDALDYYKLGLENAIKHKLPEQAGFAHVNMANWYIYDMNYIECSKHLNIALQIAEKRNDQTMIAYCKLNMGRALLMINNYNKALSLFLESLKIRKKFSDLHAQAACYKNIADVYSKKSNFETADQYYDSALFFIDKNQDKDLLSEIYYGRSQVQLARKNYDKALAYADSALKATKSTGNLFLISQAKSLFPEIYAKKGNFEKAFLTSKETEKIKAELFKKKVEGKISGVQYMADKETAKAEIEKEKFRIKNLELERQKRNLYLLGMFIVLILILILTIVLSKSNIQRKKANDLLRHKNHEILQKNEELKLQKEEIEHQKALVEQSRDLITAKKNEIEVQRDTIIIQQEQMKESIEYARKIQRAMLTPSLYINSVLPENFILFLPRDIVSGDFYWFKKTGNKVIAAVSDCTGHGVPGAFVSMLGMSFLNELASKNKITSAKDILEDLRNGIKKSLRQTLKDDDSQDDGMDLALCIIDTDSLECQFAGANNSMFLIRDNQLTVHKATLNPIGIYFREIPFTETKIQLQKNDVIYLFTDGYTDQFGGVEGRRFMMPRFRELLLEIHGFHMSKQKDELEKRLLEWQGENRRIDDILIAGIRI